MFDSTNLRFTYGMRCLGNGKEGADVCFCGIMNVPQSIVRFYEENSYILSILKEVHFKKILSE